MKITTQTDVRRQITDIFDRAGIAWEISGTGLLAGAFQAAGGPDRTEIESILRTAEVPFEPRRGGAFVSSYDMGQLAQKGWNAPDVA